MPKMSSFMIGIILFSFIAVVFGLYMAQMSENYGITYDNESLESYNQLSEMVELAEDLEEGSNIEEKTGVLDIIGAYITDAYNVVVMTKQSVNTFDTMSDQAVRDANLGAVGHHLRVALGAILLIVIVIGIIISAIMKWWL